MTKIELIGGKACYFTVGNQYVDYTDYFVKYIPNRPTTRSRLLWIAKKAKQRGFDSRITMI